MGFKPLGIVLACFMHAFNPVLSLPFNYYVLNMLDCTCYMNINGRTSMVAKGHVVNIPIVPGILPSPVEAHFKCRATLKDAEFTAMLHIPSPWPPTESPQTQVVGMIIYFGFVSIQKLGAVTGTFGDEVEVIDTANKVQQNDLRLIPFDMKYDFTENIREFESLPLYGCRIKIGRIPELERQMVKVMAPPSSLFKDLFPH